MGRSRRCRSGVTLVEMLVVLGLLSILAAVSIPSLASMGVFSGHFQRRQDLGRGTAELYSLLRSARIYAATFNVNTAVAYGFDNYVSPVVDPGNTGPLPDPLMDSVRNEEVRVIRSVALLREMPSTAGAFAGRFVPVADEQGGFHTLTGDTVVLLNDPRDAAFVPLIEPVWTPRLPELYPVESAPGVRGLNELGMTRIEAFLEDTGPMAPRDTFEHDNPVVASFPAHVFRKGSGQLMDAGSQERYAIFAAPNPEEQPTFRVIDEDTPEMYFEHRVIQLFKSTGRVKIAS